MDFFDILWLIICIGLPVISGIASAKKKNAGKGKSVPQNPEVPAESDLKEIFKNIIQEMNAQDADEDDEDDENELEEVKPAQVQVNAAEPCPSPEVRPVKSKAPVLQEDDKQQKEKINLRNLVIYSSIMEPKFKE